MDDDPLVGAMRPAEPRRDKMETSKPRFPMARELFEKMRLSDECVACAGRLGVISPSYLVCLDCKLEFVIAAGPYDNKSEPRRNQ
jgi:hypothetical protein